jgi:DNA-nicking Smr family endonuclease
MKRRDPRTLVPDFELWSQVAKTVDPLRPLRHRPVKEAPLPLPEPAPAPAISGKALRIPPSLPPYQAPLPSPGPHRGSIEPDLRRRLARGRTEIDARIDLHGLRVDEARIALNRFVHARLAQGARTLLVITGKGSPDAESGRGILRTMLPIWLAEPSLAPVVSGFGHAAREHGGEGAFYVRLRNIARVIR